MTPAEMAVYVNARDIRGLAKRLAPMWDAFAKFRGRALIEWRAGGHTPLLIGMQVCPLVPRML